MAKDTKAPTYLKKILKTYKGDNLMNVLNAIQDNEGFLSEATLRTVSKELDLPLARVYSTVSFYSFLKLESGGKKTVRVCNSPSCHLNGSTNLIKAVKKITGLDPGEHNKKFSFEITQCIGCCNEAPAVMIGGKLYGKVTEKKLKAMLKK